MTQSLPLVVVSVALTAARLSLDRMAALAAAVIKVAAEQAPGHRQILAGAQVLGITVVPVVLALLAVVAEVQAVQALLVLAP